MTNIELALQAGRRRQSPQTGLIHLCYEDKERHDTIPLYENFCFALALLRSKTAEHILEAKGLLEKLFAFQVENNFPVYLHEYPVCRDSYMGRKIFPALHWMRKEFGAVLGEALREKVDDLLARMDRPAAAERCKSPEEWAEFLLAAQMEGSTEQEALSFWDSSLMAYKGRQRQEGYEPATTLLDLFMAEGHGVWPKRILRDHPVHIRGALVRPWIAPEGKRESSILALPEVLYWGGKELLHSLYVEGEHENLCFTLPEGEAVEQNEIAWYCNASPGNQIFINGQKATTFQTGDEITVFSSVTVKIKFILVEGRGRFFGHLLKGNRPGQLQRKGESRFEAYDWKIALRTIERREKCIIKCLVDIQK